MGNQVLVGDFRVEPWYRDGVRMVNLTDHMIPQIPEVEGTSAPLCQER